MSSLSKSTAHRLMNPALAALVQAAIRVGLRVEENNCKQDCFIHGKIVSGISPISGRVKSLDSSPLEGQ